jgi:NAD(P)-dependent dehydrogenase (short-subunit alcohol dehydrogenase family)
MQRIALVTGANRGIGLEICRQLAHKGLHVILTSRDPAKGERAATTLQSEGLPVSFCQLDVTDPVSVNHARDYVARMYGRLDVLVNNAGVYPDEGVSILRVSLELLQETFAINTFGAFLTCQAFVPMMRQQGYGRVVNVSSGAGSITEMDGYTGAYRMSKVALNAMTRVLANELRHTNIKVNAMCPGWVATDMGGVNAPRTVEEGADTAVWLATLPDDGPTDGFFRDRERIPW